MNEFEIETYNKSEEKTLVFLEINRVVFIFMTSG